MTHAWLAGSQMQLPLFSNQSHFLTPQQPTTHSLAGWSQLWQPTYTWDQGSIFWQLDLTFAAASLFRCQVWKLTWVVHGNNCLASWLEISGSWQNWRGHKSTKITNRNRTPAVCQEVCKLTWVVHANICLATCNQMPSSCSNPTLIASKSHHQS